MNNRGQFAIVSIVGILIVLIAIAPILLQIVKTTSSGFSDGLDSISPVASNQIDAVESKFTGVWDYVIMFLFLFNILLLLISSFFIDTHPLFIILYIVVTFMIMIFAPYLVETVDRIWETPYFIAENTAGDLTMTEFLLDNFTGILLMIYVISGLIMYGKIKYFGNNYG